MSFLDKAREALGQAAAAVSREAGGLSLQAQLGNLDSERERVFVEIGKRARELSRQNQLKDADIEMLLKRVADIESQMEELRKQVAAQQSGAPPPPPPPPAS